MKPLHHILIIRFSAMGDVAMTVPVVHALATQYPDVRITMLSKPFARPLFEELAPNVGFMGADLQGEYKRVKGLNALYRRLTAKHFTHVADLHSVLRSDYLRLRFHLDRFKVAHVDKHRSQRRLLTAKEGKMMMPLPTVFDNYLEVFQKLGFPLHLTFTSLFCPEEMDEKVWAEKWSKRDEKELWVGVAPFAAHQGKAYPLPLMQEALSLIERQHPSCRFFLFGGGGEEEERIKEMVGERANYVSVPAMNLPLRQELMLMAQLNVMISMDSANMHLASLVETPVVSVWGATHPYAGFMGYGQSVENVVQADLSCRPCSIFGNKACWRKDYACLHHISPEKIAEKVLRML